MKLNLKDIFENFPGGQMKIFLNDTNNPVCFQHIEDFGVNIFNLTQLQEITKVRDLCGDKVCLLGNIPPIDLINGIPESIYNRGQNYIGNFVAHTGGNNGLS